MLNYKSMGVINITPNSFSDGNLYNESKSFEQRFNEAASDFDIIDIGAESTAPFNESVSSDEELKRFENTFFPLLESSVGNELTISVDTYKVNVFRHIHHQIISKWPKAKIIFNDVSGKIDDELISLLESDLDFEYVFSHNLCEKRVDTIKHMEKTIDGDPIEHLKEYFQLGLKTLKCFDKKIILDPCFGFSKTREQNHFIIKNFAQIFGEFNPKYSILFGVSRKSFMRFPHALDAKSVEGQKFLESLSALVYQNLLKSMPDHNFIFRVHETSALNALKQYNSNFI